MGSDDELWDEEQALSELLRDGEIVIKKEHLEGVIDSVNTLIHRARYYKEYPEHLEFFESLLDDLQFVTLGARGE